MTMEERHMAKVGAFVSDPRAGAYCQITLDNGDKIVVNHDKGGFKGGRMMIDLSRLMGFSSTRLFECDLDSAVGKAALAELTRDAAPGTVGATPLGAFVEHVKTCVAADDVRRKCAELLARTGGA
jgi:hypothetical protein